MLVVLLALAMGAPTETATVSSSSSPHAVVTAVPAPVPHTWDGPRLSLELVVDGAAQAVTASTAPTSALALRFGGVNSIAAGPFWGLDGTVLVSNQTAGTVDVGVAQIAGLVEARGLGGARFRRGFVGVGAFGFGGLAGGIGATATHVFDHVVTRVGPAWRARGGAGVEVDVGPLLLRVETGAGVRDLNLEIFGTAGLGFRW
jgi:hypothetical protein